MTLENNKINNNQNINLNININVITPGHKIKLGNSPVLNKIKNSSIMTAKFRELQGKNQVSNNQLKLKENQINQEVAKYSGIASNPSSNKLLFQIHNLSSNLNLLNNSKNINNIASSSLLPNSKQSIPKSDVKQDSVNNSNNEIKPDTNSKLNSTNILNLSSNNLTPANSNKKYSKISYMSNITETSAKNEQQVKLSNSISSIETNLHLRVIETLNL